MDKYTYFKTMARCSFCGIDVYTAVLFHLFLLTDRSHIILQFLLQEIVQSNLLGQATSFLPHLDWQIRIWRFELEDESPFFDELLEDLQSFRSWGENLAYLQIMMLSWKFQTNLGFYFQNWEKRHVVVNWGIQQLRIHIVSRKAGLEEKGR